MTNNDRFEHEVLPHVATLSHVALHLTRDPHEAEDLAQDTLLRACRFWNRFELGTDCRAWLVTILVNRFRSRIKPRRETPIDPTDLDRSSHESLWAGHFPSPECFALARSSGAAVERALLDVSPPCREAFRLVDLEDRTYEDAATIAGCPLNTLRTRLFRGRERLRRDILGSLLAP